LFTPDWIVRYMVENSLGRLWVEGHPDDELKAGWKYYLEEAEQEPDVQAQLAKIREEYAAIKPEDIKCIDPCMGSGHILVYMFDVLVQIYQAYGYSTREAVQSIVENNLYGLDIDDRAAQLAYFAVMMKARQYDRRFFTRNIQPHVCAIQESAKMPEDAWDYFGAEKDIAQRVYMSFADAKEYGSLIEPNVTMAELDALDARLTEMDHMADYGNLAVQALMGTVLIVMEPLMKQARVLVQRYDTVISNPPYMNSNSMSPKLLSFAKKNYPLTWADMFSTCMEKGLSMTKPNRYMSMITMESWMFLSTFEDFRRSILKRDTISSLIHMPYLGKGGTSLGIAFGNCAFVVKTESMSKYKAHYECIRYYETDDNGIPFSFPMHNERFGHKAQEGFSAISSASISYWASENMLKVFRERKTLLNYMDARSGISTGDNNMFYRCWFECEAAKIAFDSAYTPSNSNYKWFPTIRGGDFRKWYGNMENVLNLQNEGYAIRTSGKNYRLRTPAFYNKRGITWNRISSRDVSFRLKTEQVNFGENSPCMFLDEKQVLTLMGFLNSIVAKAMLECINSTMTYQVLDIQSIPYIPAQRDDIDQIVGENILLAKEDWDAFEKSWDYQEHPFVRIAKKHGSSELTLRQIFELWSEECNDRFNRVRRNEELLNKYYIDVYNLAEVLSPNVAEEDVTIKKADLKRDIRSFISYAIGCLLGRYSLSKPGLVFAGGILNAHDYGNGIAPDKDNILPICDDEYFDDDIVGKFVRFVEIVFGKSNLDENLSYIAEALGGSASPKDVIRMYFLNEFFADHCANYFVTSVGKRPIYWLFDSGKQNGFKALIYMHRYAPDTIARIRTDYVHEQQSRYRTAIADLENRIVSASTSERVKLTKQLTKVKAQAEELRLYEEKIHHLADQMISIDLDDGVKVNYAKFADVLAKIK